MLEGDLHGTNKKLGERQPGTSNSGFTNSRYYYLLPVVWLAGCTSLKKAAIVGAVTTAAAGVGSVVSSGVLVPAVAGGLAASVMSVGADLSNEKTGDITLNNCTESNFWDVIGQLVEMGGWMLILVILIPMILGWILPGPLEKRKKRN
jgi:phosphate/sulfate permease